MKKYLIAIILFIRISNLYCQITGWDTIHNVSPNYSFLYPGTPLKVDTLGVKLYLYAIDSTAGFRVIQYDYAGADTTNTAFSPALILAGGDTLTAIINTLLTAGNSTLNSISSLDTIAGYQWKEVKLTYNVLDAGRPVIAFVRFYYKRNTLITFTVGGLQANITALNSYKTQFFNSILFGPLISP